MITITGAWYWAIDDVRLTGIETLFNEDFSNGIPNDWTEEYSTGNSTAPWIYRGPNTTPNNTVGSQGFCWNKWTYSISNI